MGPKDLIPELISSITTLIAVLIGIVGGVWAYYRQKEHEIVQRRYLEEGLDVLISTAEQSLNVFSHNWAKCLEHLKTFRDIENVEPSELERGFLDLPESRFSLTANYRVNSIVDSPTVWYVFQLVLSFCESGSAVARNEIPAALKQKLIGTDIDATREEIVEEAEKILVELNEESQRYHIFVGKMHRIVDLFEKQNFRYKTVKKLAKNPTVLDVVKTLEDSFADKLAEHDKDAT